MDPDVCPMSGSTTAPVAGELAHWRVSLADLPPSCPRGVKRAVIESHAVRFCAGRTCSEINPGRQVDLDSCGRHAKIGIANHALGCSSEGAEG